MPRNGRLSLPRLRLLAAALAALFTLAMPPGRAAATELPAPKEVASYQISVRLDTDAKQLSGSERISFTNPTSRPVEELYLHLYPNAFRNENSTFMREGESYRRRSIAQNNWGWMDVTSLRLASGLDLLPGASINDTVMRVPLPESLGPGRTLELTADFTVKLPMVIARMGYLGDHYTIAQWFPKLAAITEQRGWVAPQYHADSEFFADFGNYRVDITLPERFVVGACGVPAGEKSNGDGTRTLTFESKNVHDFSWAANPTFKEFRTRAAGTEIRLLLQAQHLGLQDRFLSAATAAVENFGQWYGPYPYPLLTIVDAPDNAGAGMEYPTLVTVAAGMIPIPGVLEEEQVTIHEIGHQWWYGMVATNEFEEAWLDEGFTTYSTRKLSDQLYGPSSSYGTSFGFQVGGLAVDRGQYLTLAQLDPVLQDSWHFYNSSSYAANVYSKADLILTTLERNLGEDEIQALLRDYFQQYAYRHPTTDDFLGVVRRHAGNRFDSFFQQALSTSVLFDYSVEPPSSLKQGEGYATTVVARRLGDGVIPVDVVTSFQDGHQERESWDGAERWVRYSYQYPAPVVKVEVDSRYKVALDTRWANNSYTSWFDLESVLKRSADLLWLLQAWLRSLAYVV